MCRDRSSGLIFLTENCEHLPSDVWPFSYSQPDRLNPNYGPLHTTAITPRTTQ
jgi:hypothetical protein